MKENVVGFGQLKFYRPDALAIGALVEASTDGEGLLLGTEVPVISKSDLGIYGIGKAGYCGLNLVIEPPQYIPEVFTMVTLKDGSGLITNISPSTGAGFTLNFLRPCYEPGKLIHYLDEHKMSISYFAILCIIELAVLLQCKIVLTKDLPNEGKINISEFKVPPQCQGENQILAEISQSIRVKFRDLRYATK